MSKNIKVSLLVLVVLVVLGLVVFGQDKKGLSVGVVTPLTGGAAYWGESTAIGVKMAEAELTRQGIKVNFIMEDGQLDPAKSLNAAQKLVNVDGVDAMCSEFNPASIAVSSFLKDKKTFHLFDSAAFSPLNENPDAYKTYLDYKDSCAEVAKYLKSTMGAKTVGILKMNLEHGNLCADGVIAVFGPENVFVESYNPGVTDFRTSILKLSAKNVDAIFHASFQPETLASLRQLDELRVTKTFVGLAETITSDIITEYSKYIQGDIFFGLPEVSADLKKRIDEVNEGKPVGDYNAAGLGYVHMVQLGRALDECGNDSNCISKEMAKAENSDDVGFQGFVNRIAKFNNRIVKFQGSAFVDVK